jgi:bacterioferritin-associated ferredoxin
MIVCSCNVFTDGDVRRAIDGWMNDESASGRPTLRTAGEVYDCLGCTPKCGRCAPTIRRIMDERFGGQVD